MNDARLHDRFRPDRLDRVRQPFQSVAHDEEHIPHAPVLQIDQDTHPKLRALTAGAGPQAQNVLAAVHRDPDGRVDRPVRDLTLADLDDDGVNEHGHVDAVEWPRRPVVHLRDDFVGDPRDRLFRHRRPVNLREMRGDLPGGHAFRIQRQHDLVNLGQPALPLLYDLRFERALSIPWHINAHLTGGVRDHRLALGHHRRRSGLLGRHLPPVTVGLPPWTNNVRCHHSRCPSRRTLARRVGPETPLLAQ